MHAMPLATSDLCCLQNSVGDIPWRLLLSKPAVWALIVRAVYADAVLKDRQMRLFRRVCPRLCLQSCDGIVTFAGRALLPQLGHLHPAHVDAHLVRTLRSLCILYIFMRCSSQPVHTVLACRARTNIP